MVVKNPELEWISGLTERITYHNEENGFCVLRVKVKGKRDLVTVTGNVPAISVGEYIKAHGQWYNDKNHGLQFKAQFLKSLPPETLEGIEKYLGSGLIKGIGPYFAKKLVLAFKEQVFDIIENSSHLLSNVEGIGKIRVQTITRCWQEQKIIREIMIFLQSHGVGTTRATRIYKTYGDQAIEIVSANPYQLAKDIRGIGFISADTIAKKLGIAENSIIRARAGIQHVLLEATSEGHCGLPIRMLQTNTAKLLQIPEDIIEEAIKAELQDKTLTLDFIKSVQPNLEEKEISVPKSIEEPFVFLTSYYVYEKQIAYMLKNLKGENISANSASLVSFTNSPIKTEKTVHLLDSSSLPSFLNIDQEKAITWVQSKSNITLAEAQKQAISQALNNKVMVLTGGPGTGKTTIINSIVHILRAKHLKVQLAAPTGRAAKRLSETTNCEAVTIHRLLAIDPKTGKFKYNEENKLKCDYLVVDEISMVDVQLFYLLLKAIPQDSGLLMVGDVDQLPSVGPGQVLADIINSQAITTVKLTEIFRQAITSDIIKNAHLINRGVLPKLLSSPSSKDKSQPLSTSNLVESDFYFIESEPGELLINRLIKLVKERIPSKFNLEPVKDIQVLCPMQRGGNGVRALNDYLQKALNPNLSTALNQITKFGETFCLGDKVMQLENNYDKEVYNGDIGIITSVSHEDQEVEIIFDLNKKVIYDFTELDEITLAYATTIHKAQGSEYPAVIIPLTMQSFRMLKRNLIYTAITRGKKLVIILGQKKALAIAVKNGQHGTRYTKLRDWLSI